MLILRTEKNILPTDRLHFLCCLARRPINWIGFAYDIFFLRMPLKFLTIVISLEKPIDPDWFKMSCFSCPIFSCVFCFFLKTKKLYKGICSQFVIFNPWNIPWNWIALSQNYLVKSAGLLDHLTRRDTGRLVNEDFTSNPIVSSKQ